MKMRTLRFLSAKALSLWPVHLNGWSSAWMSTMYTSSARAAILATIRAVSARSCSAVCCWINMACCNCLASCSSVTYLICVTACSIAAGSGSGLLAGCFCCRFRQCFTELPDTTLPPAAFVLSVAQRELHHSAPLPWWSLWNVRSSQTTMLRSVVDRSQSGVTDTA